MNTWITDKSPIIQGDKPNTYLTLCNQLLYDNGTTYLIPRNTLTDNYTMPLGIDKDKRDIRPSHLHDIGCKYHQVIIVDLPLQTIKDKYIYTNFISNRIYCRDIPIKYLKVIDINFNDCNNLLYKGMIATNNIPNSICKLYRFGVNFNIGWLFTGKDNIDLNNLYNSILSTI